MAAQRCWRLVLPPVPRLVHQRASPTHGLCGVRPLPLLRRDTGLMLTMSQEQATCLLANAFFCTFPRSNATGTRSEDSACPDINVNRTASQGSSRAYSAGLQSSLASKWLTVVVEEEETLVEELVVQEEEMRGETEEVWTEEQEDEIVVQVEETLVEKMVEKEMTRKEDQNVTAVGQAPPLSPPTAAATADVDTPREVLTFRLSRRRGGPASRRFRSFRSPLTVAVSGNQNLPLATHNPQRAPPPPGPSISRAGEARSNGESFTTWSALSSARTASIRSKSPQAILALFGPQMTHREKLELVAIQEVWYFALRNRSRGPNNDGYDDHEHHYIPVQHEHLHYRYEVVKKIGEGGQGQVIRCLDHMRNTLVAVKILVSPLSSKRDKSQRMEIKMALALQGEGSDEDYNVVKVLNHFDFRGHHCIVLELLKESLHDVITEAGLRQLHMGMVKTYTRGILKFLCHTKARSIIHADIKPENVLIKDTVTGTIRVTDFGTSFFVKSQPLHVGGTLPFQSPEVLLGYRLTCAVDMWALGCTVAELVTGRELFQSDSRDDHLPCCMEILGLPPRCMMDAAPDGMHYFDRVGMMFCPVKRRVPGSLSLHGALNSQDLEFVEFVSSCLRWDPDCRMTPAQALGHSWLRTAATSTTSNATTTATPGSVQCFGAAERRAEPALPPSSALAQASKWLTVVEEETLVEELLVQEEETLVEELVVQEEETLVEELVVQEEETLVEELLVQEETLVEELLVQEEETLVEELVVQEEETLVEELVVQEEETLVEELVVQEEETLVEELVVQEETLVEELVVQEEEEMRGETEEVWTKEQEEEMVVQVEETLVEKMVEEMRRKEDQVMVMQGEKRKRGSLARIGRTIRSLLRRVLLCGGRSTTQ
ncbi:unnamed protein product [Lampetra planeri]